MSLEKKVFEGKSVSDLFKEVYDNSRKKDKKINTIVDELKTLVNDLATANVISPLIKDYLEVGVKNDEHLLKILAIVQKFENGSGAGKSEIISADELENILAEIETELPSHRTPISSSLSYQPENANI